MPGWVIAPHDQVPEGAGPLFPTEDGQVTFYSPADAPEVEPPADPPPDPPA